jgi:hypothetical protein
LTAYRKAFPDFKADGVQSISSSFDGISVKGNPHQELTFKTPRTFLGPKEEFRTPKDVGSPSRTIGCNASSKLQPHTIRIMRM